MHSDILLKLQTPSPHELAGESFWNPNPQAKIGTKAYNLIRWATFLASKSQEAEGKMKN